MDKINPLYICFSELDDPRKEKHSSRHLLIDILMLTILAVICGADSWVAVERFGYSKEDWLRCVFHRDPFNFRSSISSR